MYIKDNVDQSIRKRPYPFLMEALNLLKTNTPITVEIGSMRGYCPHDIDEYHHHCCNDGHSSIILARASKEFHTVDIHLDTSKITLRELKRQNFYDKSKVFVYNGDGLNFLKVFDKKIDFLYLDAWDVGLEGYDTKHLEAFQIAESKLNNNAIVLIDDTDIGLSAERGLYNDEEAMGGKGRLLIPYLLDKPNYKLVFKGRQTCFVKLD
jgi:hydroxymethylpyrimidine pyrophosphatase-like HAD family hydrolase